HDGEATRERAGAAEPEPAREGDAAGDGAGRCPLDERDEREGHRARVHPVALADLDTRHHEEHREHAEGDAIDHRPPARTARRLRGSRAGLGRRPKAGLGLTGVRAEAPGRAGDGPTFALLGELDALVVAGHPDGDPATGAAHACGHNAQVAALMGAAMGLLDAKAFDALSGRVVFFAVPAEEYGDIEWRVAQARAGKLEFLGGKPELLRLGHFDDVDLSMMIHLTSRPEDGKTGVPVSNNGCLVKTIRYVGRASHAGGAPHMGINALY